MRLSTTMALLALGCGGGPGGEDAGMDASRADSAVVAVDSGSTDSGRRLLDAGSDAAIAEDASTSSDGGPPIVSDGGADACTSTTVCPPIPSNCMFVGGSECTCGSLWCEVPTGPCGGTRCRPAEFCNYPSGTCGSAGGGSCTTPPDVCPDDFAPVCGCDGVTYANACGAAANEQSIAFEGECPPRADCRMTGCPGTDTCQACLGLMGINYVCLPAGSIC